MPNNSNNRFSGQVISWCMYDWANSAFATVIISAILPVYFSKVVAADLPQGKATIYWSYTISVSLLVTALLAPVIGAISDNSNKRKLFLQLTTAIGIIFTSLLYFSGSGKWVYTSFIFIMADIGFALSEIFYNSLLKFIAKPTEVERVSTLGYALGYLGGGLLLGINLLFFRLFDDQDLAARISFLSVALWWAVFTIPLVLKVDEPILGNVNYKNKHIKAAFVRLRNTYFDIRKYRNLFIFLIAFWIYNDGIGTIIKLAAVYGAEIGIGSTALIGALLVTQFVGIPFSILFGRLAIPLGAKNCIYIGLTVYTLISIAAFFIETALHFWILAILVGTVQGGTQALSRSLFSTMVPESKSSEFFGFYGMSTKFAGIAGPLVFAVVNQLTGSSRLSIISLVVFFVSGIILLSKVDVEEAIRSAAG